MNDLKTTDETFDTNEIENNTKALQELKKALLAYQETLKNTKSTDIFGLEKLKNAMSSFNSLITTINNLKRISAEGLGLTNYVTLS